MIIDVIISVMYMYVYYIREYAYVYMNTYESVRVQNTHVSRTAPHGGSQVCMHMCI